MSNGNMAMTIQPESVGLRPASRIEPSRRAAPAPNPIIEVLREEMSGVQVNQIAPDLAIAIWEMHFEMKVRGSNPIGEDVRVSAVLRNTPDGWRYIHWVESPKATMVYIEDLFEKGVAPGWDEYYEAATQRKKKVWENKRQTAR